MRSSGIAMTALAPSGNWKLNARLDVQIVIPFSPAFIPHSLASRRVATGVSPLRRTADGIASALSANAAA